MVAIVTGNGLGLTGSSASVLGAGGQLGSAATGSGNDAATVNASTGNLVLQRQDELLIGIGPDLGVVRTYNSQGSFDFDNNDSWQLSLYRQLSSLTGKANSAGSSITRTGADGAQLVYSYDATLGKYVNKDGSGSYDTLSYTKSSNAWTWTDGDSRVSETYAAGTAGTWRITSVADPDGNALTYSYDANGRITQIVDANGETTQLVYNATGQLLQIDVLSAAGTTTRVRYGYDAQGRLASVSTDLTPEDGSIVDGNTYVTTYGYDGASNRIASITNSDGTQTSFTYDASGRVATITDGLGHVTTLTYNAGNTVITDASGQSTTLTYDAAGQLTRLQGPAGSGQDIHYTYNTNGDVTQRIDSRGNTVTYTYDAHGNQTRQQDSAGHVVERTYDAANRLLTATVYAVLDPDGAGAGTASAPQTTRYAYDGEGHLRFVVSAEGRVTEYRYNAQGQQVASLQYTGDVYPVSGLTAPQSLSEAELATWIGSADSTHSQRTDSTFDARGQLSTRTVYTAVDASGNGMLDGSEATTHYIYDQGGNLRQTIDARGVATTGIADDYVTSYAYDGLNRLVTRTDALGNTTTTLYSDATRQVVVTLANGLSTTRTYDAAGQLLSVAQSDASGALGTTQYLYDALGNLRQVTDPLGQKTYALYDSASRQVGTIDASGALTETVYNANGQVIRTVRYATAVNPSALAGDATQLTLASVRPATASADRITYHLYDAAGRLAKDIDAQGAVTGYRYDGAGRLLGTTRYANPLTATQLIALAATSTEVLPDDGNTVPVADAANDRITRNLYDNDGLLIGTLDAAGYLTEYVFDAAGQQTAVVRYHTQTPSAHWATGTLAQLRPTANANDQQTQYLYNARGELTGTLDAEGYLIEHQYDLVGNRIATLRYATAVTYTAGNTVAQSRPADALTNPENQTQTWAYDANNRLVRSESQPDGLVTTYSYDSVGNLTGTVKALGSAEERAQQRRYDSQGRVVAELGGEGVAALAALGASPTTAQIDEVWNRYGTRYVYDAAGRRTAMLTPDGSTTAGHRTVYYYDAEGQLTHRINALGEVVEYRYNAFDDRTAERRYDTRIASTTLATLTGGATNSLGTAVSDLTAGGYSETAVVYDLRGQAASLTDALGNTDTRTYNAFGELVQSTDQIDASNSLVTSYAYDRRGQLTTTTEDVGGLNRLTSALYDAFGRLTQATDALGGMTQYQYDRLGRAVSVTNPLNVTQSTTYDAFARVLTRTDGRGNTTTISYDSAARSLTVTTAEGIATTTVRNRHGETVSLTDGRGNVTTYAYNRDGQFVSVTAPNGTTSTAYDAAGQVIATEDANGTETHYTYDAAGRVLTRTLDPTGLSLQTAYRYDAQGRAAWVQNAAGVWTRTDYDAKGQVVAVTVDPTSVPDANGNLVAHATGLNLTTAYTFDARGKTLTVTEGAGTASARTTEYQYDTLGRRTQQIQDPAGLHLVTAYTYDANDNVVAKTDANGQVTRYTYDADHRLVYTVDATGAVTKHDYDANGNLTAITAYANRISLAGLTAPASSAEIAARLTPGANDQLTRHVYDRDNRRTHTIDAANYVTAYTFDANGNVLTSTRYANPATGTNADGTPQVAANAQDQVTQYTYDDANRVTDVTDAAGNVTHHVYDAAGHVTDTIRAYGTAQAVTTHYQYDAAGRLTDEIRAFGTSDASTTHYQYDALGHQTVITEAYGTAAARTTRQEFDAAGRKTAAIQVMGSGVEYRTTTEYNAAGDIVKVTDANGNAGYFYTDALGRVTLQVNPDGAAIAHTYDALGHETETIRYATKVTGASTASVPAVTTSSTDQKQTAVYDALGQRTEIRTWWGPNATDYYTESFSFDAFGNVKSATARNGATTTTTYDQLNRKVAETLPIQSRNSSGTLVPVVNTYAYDMAGNLVTRTEAAGLPEQRVTTYEYDRLNRQTREIGEAFLAYDPATQTESTVTPTRSKTYDARGNVTSETDANGNTAYHYYDAQDRKVGTLSADGTYTAWTYDAAGNKTSQTVYANPVSNPTEGTLPTVTADAANDRTVTYSYDLMGRVTGTEIRDITTGAYNTTTGQYVVTTGSLTTSTVYDALGNVVKTIDANGNSTRTYYNGAGQATAQLDAAGYLTAWTRDAYGNVARETKYANAIDSEVLSVTDSTTLAQLLAAVTTSTNDRITETAYDGLNRIVTESRLNVAAGTVDGNGNLTATTATATLQYRYDGLNNIVQKTDATNAVTDWTYDGLGRQTSQINPTMTDYTGASVRPQTDTEYDGLNNVNRELIRDTDDTTETHDHITVYTYTVGGRLAAETDAAGARTEYRYDANGNVTQKTLKNRVNADGIVTDDVTLIQYDGQNRQTRTQDLSTGLVSEVQYNGFSQITGKRTYTGTAPTTWQEFAEYDRAGRLWKGNSGDGVTRVIVRDGNGNATLTISGTLDMRDKSLADVLDQVPIIQAARVAYAAAKQNGASETAAGQAAYDAAIDKGADAATATNAVAVVTGQVAQQTLYTISVYDQKNQLIDTLQPDMAANHEIAIVQANTSGQATFVGNGSTIQIGAGSTVQNTTATTTDPIAPGTVNVGYGTVGWAANFSSNRTSTAYDQIANVNISVPTGVALGTGNITVEVTLTGSAAKGPDAFGRYPAPVTQTKTLVLSGAGNAAFAFKLGQWPLFGSANDKPYQYAQDLRIRVVKSTASGSTQVLNQFWPGKFIYTETNAFGQTGVTSASGSAVLPKKLYLTGQPTSGVPDTNRLVLAYRTAGSTGPYTFVNVSPMVNTASARMGGMYAFDWSSIAAGNYEYQYLTMNVAGNVLNQQSGTFNTTNSASPTVSTQTSIAMGGPGRALFGSGGSINFVEQGNATVGLATSLTLRYRVKDTSAWTEQVFSPNVLFGTNTPGWFAIPSSTFAVGTEYDFDLVAKNSSGVEVNRARTTLQWNANGVPQVGTLVPYSTQPAFVTLTERTSTQYVDVSYRVAGSSGAYTTVRVNPTSTGSGVFSWDANSLVADPFATYDYDVVIKAYDAGDLLNNHTTATLRLGSSSSVLSSSTVAVPQLLRITPTQSGVSYIDLGYRLKGGNADYTPLTTTTYTSGGVTEYRAELPAGLALGDYEYRYTAYALDTSETDPDLIVTPDDPNTPADETVYGTQIIQHALGSATGDFTVGETSSSATRIDYVVTQSSQNTVIHRRQSYNAFGEVVSETDGRGNTVEFEYNALGQLTLKRNPETDITLANGFVTRDRPETAYTYDLAGRLVAVKDANGHINTQTWLPGADDNQIVFERHADGGLVTRKFDIFGNLVSQTDEAGRVTAYEYDAMDRLTEITRPSLVTDTYAYDAAGQRIRHTNALGNTEKMYYDALGRITQTTSFAGFATQYNYVYSNAIVGLGGLTVGGWQKTTTESTGRTLIDRTDVFGHLTWHKDLGDRVFVYDYNYAGWLTNQHSLSSDSATLPTGITYSNPATGAQYSGQNIEYGHYANGYIQSIWDKATGTYTRYEYDADGNRTFEGYVTLKNPVDLMAGAKDYYQYATIEYDELNRITRVVDPKAIISYEYDANSNRRMVKSVYHDGLNGAQRIQEYWYSYDQMDRFLVTMGQLSGARATTAEQAGINIVTGTTGTAIAYNFAGQRMQATNGVDGTVESYSYTADGYLTDVRINGALRTQRVNDALGRVATYLEYSGSAGSETSFYSRTTTYDADNRVLRETGTDGTTDYYYYSDATDTDGLISKTGAGALARTTNVNTVDGSTTTVHNYYDYQYWDEAKQDDITTNATNTKLKKNNRYWKPGYSDLSYDVNGHLTGARDREGDRSFRYVTDAQGQILLRDEIAGGVVNRVHRYYYVDGKRVGDVGNDGPTRTDYAKALAQHKSALNNKTSVKGNTDKYANFTPIASADFDQNYEPIGPTYPGAAASSYTVRNGDTLQSIALAVWGDSAMWYLIADANGLTSDQALTAGMNLTIPNKVTNIHNNSGTYRVYNPGEAIGDVSPTLPDAPPPPRKKGGCGGFAIIIVAIVAVVATIATAGVLAAPAGAGITSTSIAAGLANPAIAAAAAAAGSVAGQLTGMALGIQDKFSWGAVASAAIGGVVGTGNVFGLNNSSWYQIAANATLNNATGQAISVGLGVQEEFSWTSLAVSAISAPIANEVSEAVLGPKNNLDFGGQYMTGWASNHQTAARVVDSAIRSGTRALTSLVIEGSKISWASLAAGVVSDAIFEDVMEPVRERAWKVRAEEIGKTQPIYDNENDTYSYAQLDSNGRPVIFDGYTTKNYLNYKDPQTGDYVHNEEGSEEAREFLARLNKEERDNVGLMRDIYDEENRYLGTVYQRSENDIASYKLTAAGRYIGDVLSSINPVITLGSEAQEKYGYMVSAGYNQVNPNEIEAFMQALSTDEFEGIFVAYGSANDHQAQLAVNHNLLNGDQGQIDFVYGVSNPTISFAVDNVLHAALPKFAGLETVNSAIIERELSRFVRIFGEGAASVKVMAHSQMTIDTSIALSKLSADEKFQISYTAIGNASGLLVEGLGAMNLVEIQGDPVAKFVGGNLQDKPYFEDHSNYQYIQLSNKFENPMGYPNNHSNYLYQQDPLFRGLIGAGALPSHEILKGAPYYNVTNYSNMNLR